MTGYLGEYWNTPSANSAPSIPTRSSDLTRNEPAIDFVWNEASPAPVINPDHFVARYTKTQDFVAGNYTFTTKSDDGVRLYLDNVLIIDNWTDHGLTTDTATINLDAAPHALRLEFYEKTGGALIQFSFTRNGPATSLPSPTPTPTFTPTPTPTGIAITGYKGEYYNNRTLSGQPVLIRDDVQIDFVWNEASPAPSLPADQFSVRWTKTLTLSAGSYEFTTATDDGVRLYIDNQLLIDKWIDQGTTTYTITRDLTSGSHDFKIEYYENYGGAVAKFSYRTLQSLSPSPTPTSTPSPTPASNLFSGEFWNLSRDEFPPPAFPTLPPDYSHQVQDINFVWNDLSPNPVIHNDGFIARWQKKINVSAGTYRFTASADDGVRVYRDNIMIIDGWKDQGTTTYTSDQALTSGDHDFKVEYYEHGGGSVIIVKYELVGTGLPAPTPSPTGGGGSSSAQFISEFWNSPGAGSSPAIPVRNPDFTRLDDQINFVWNDLSPAPAINADHFVARFTKTESFSGGTYTFTLKSDDGVRFWVDGQLVIDDWIDHGLTVHTPTLPLTAGNHNLKMEYYENSGGSVAILEYNP